MSFMKNILTYNFYLQPFTLQTITLLNVFMFFVNAADISTTSATNIITGLTKSPVTPAHCEGLNQTPNMLQRSSSHEFFKFYSGTPTYSHISVHYTCLGFGS